MTYDFTPYIKMQIKKAYAYSQVKWRLDKAIKPKEYDYMLFFTNLLAREPFQAFMELENFGYKRTLNTLLKYNIPYTSEQERRARVYYDVTEKMKRERSDYVSMYVENIKDTGIVKLDDSYTLTTEKTLKLARIIKQLPNNKQTDVVLYENKLDPIIQRTKEQYDAIATILKNQVSCLIGGAGTGKSFVTSNIIKQLQANNKSVAILAPTHKARESLQDKLEKETGDVRTIHSFIFKPEKKDVIVIDEAGMLSTPLLYSLLKHYDGEQLIFIGDKNQLPPIEYGRPFELIQERFTTCEIKTNRRSESADIIAMGREILGIPQNANMAHDNIEMVSTITEAFQCGAEVGLSFMKDNVDAINEHQRLKTGASSIYPAFKIGEEIIANSNDAQGNRYYNGQLFKVISYNAIQNKKTKRVIIIKDEKDLSYNFDYSYGLTIHKSQGSEWDIVAYEPTEKDTQNLAYVAVTRAKKKLIIIGDGLKSIYPPERKWRQLVDSYSI